MTERLSLPDGQWADLSTDLTTGQFRAIVAAAEAATSGKGAMIDWASTVGRVMTEAWSLAGLSTDVNRDPPLGPVDWDRAGAKLTNRICRRAQELYAVWQADADPKGTDSLSSAS